MSKAKSTAAKNKHNFSGYLAESRFFGEGSSVSTLSKEHLVSQNVKLKSKIFTLSAKFEEIVEREREKRKRINDEYNDESTSVKEKKDELKKQQQEIIDLRNSVEGVKRQLKTVQRKNILVEKEDELRFLKGEFSTLEEEKESLLLIKKQQKKAIQSIFDEKYEQKINSIKDQIKEAKQQSLALIEKLKVSQKSLRKSHQQFIKIQCQGREQQNQSRELELNKAKNTQIDKSEIITEETIRELEKEISSIEERRKEEEKQWQSKINSVDRQIKEKKEEEEKKLMEIKEREKECRLNELKIRELARPTRKPKPQPEETDLKEFKHKRNIKKMPR